MVRLIPLRICLFSMEACRSFTSNNTSLLTISSLIYEADWPRLQSLGLAHHLPQCILGQNLKNSAIQFVADRPAGASFGVVAVIGTVLRLAAKHRLNRPFENGD